MCEFWETLSFLSKFQIENCLLKLTFAKVALMSDSFPSMASDMDF